MSEPISLTPIEPAQLGVLHDLWQFYAYEFSDVVAIEVGADGRFEVDLKRWLHEPEREAFFIRSGDKLAGFVLLGRGSHLREDASVMDVGEFFVLRYVRRRNVGKLAARAAFARHPGPWEVRVRVRNQNALHFWQQSLHELPGFHTVDWRNQDADWRVFCFDNSRP